MAGNCRSDQDAVAAYYGWYVYVISEEGDAFSKIGTAGTAKYRLNSLQNGNPRRLSILTTWHFKSRDDAFRVEKGALTFFDRRGRLSRRDWLACPADLAVIAVRWTIQELGLKAKEVAP